MLNGFQQFIVEYALYSVVVGIVASLVLIAAFFRCYPTRLAIFSLSGAALIALVAFLLDNSSLILYAVVIDACAVLAMTIDLVWVASRRCELTATRATERVVSLRQPFDVELRLENASQRPITVELVDDSDANMATARALDLDEILATPDLDSFSTDSNAARFSRREIPANSIETFRYRMVWNRRGSFRFDFVSIRTCGALKLWHKYRRLPCRSEFRVYPNLCQLTQLDLLARASNLHLLGVRRARRLGREGDFEQLRDYTRDDQYKHIDWKATARRRKLTVRDYQTSRNQRIILALDSGRMAMNSSRGVVYFDSALNSALALAYIALKQGDEVGLLIFSNRVRRYIPPRSGMAQINTLIRAVFDVFPERVESRYDRAFAYLKEHCSKRSMVALITNVVDERNVSQIETQLVNLVGKHLPLGLFLREDALFDAVERFESRERLDDAPETPAVSDKLVDARRQFRKDSPQDEIENLFYKGVEATEGDALDDFYRAAVAADILNWRRKALISLENRGVLTLDVAAEEAAISLVNKYLEIKARNIL